MNVPGAWATSTGTGVTVAVIVGGYDFIADAAVSADGDGRDGNPADPGDWYSANEFAAVTNNNKGVAGIAHGAKISPLRVLGKCGGYDSDIIDAIT